MQRVKSFTRLCSSEKPLNEQINNFLDAKSGILLQNIAYYRTDYGEEILMAVFEVPDAMAGDF